MKANGHEIIRDTREALSLLSNDEHIAVDLETSGLSPQRDKIAVVTMYGEESSTLAVLHVRGSVPQDIREFLAQPDREYTYHNGVTFDLPYLLNNGVQAVKPRLFDTMVGAGVVITTDRADQSKSLQAEVERRLGVYLSKEITRDEARKAAAGKPVKRKKSEEGAAKHGGWMEPELDDAHLLYCADDILHMHALRRSQIEKAEKQGQSNALKLEMQILSSVARMSHNGLPLHVPSLDAYRAEKRIFLAEQLAILQSSFGETNVNSPVQVKKIMRDLGMKIPTVTEYKLNPVTGKRERIKKESTGKELLNAIAERGVAGLVANGLLDTMPGDTPESFTRRAEFAAETMGRIIKIRKALKAVDFYDDYWLSRYVSARGRIHAGFRQAGTATLRFSSSNPNLQQWPKDMRSVIGGEEGMSIVAADFSQIEVVIAAELAQDAKLLALIARGGDTHRMVAAQALKINESAVTDKQRKAFKAGNFCFIFGGTPETFRDYALSFGADLTPEEAQQIHDLYFAEFDGLRRWKERAIETVQDKSRQVVEVRLRSGGVRHLLRRDGTLKSTTILNTNVQGNAAAGMKFAILECKKAGLDIYIGASVHDELVGVVPTRYAAQYAEALQACMIRGMAKVLHTPARTEVHVGTFWK